MAANAFSFLSFRGSRNLAAWATAGTLAYFLWVRPEQQAAKERAAARAVAGGGDRDRVAPLADPQIGGLMRGSKSG